MEKSNIKTSIIIPVYNTENYIVQCLDSVLQQTLDEIEVIIVDDGSTDASPAILDEYKNQNHNIRVITQNNGGPGAARNTGLKYAQGEYVYFLDSDDYIEQNAIETCYKCAKENKLDLVLFDAKIYVEKNLKKRITFNQYNRVNIVKDYQKIYTGREYLKAYMHRASDAVSSGLMFFSKEFIEKKKILFMPQVFYEDEEFRFKVMLNTQRLMYIPKLLYNRRYRNHSIMTSDMTKKKIESFSEIVREMMYDAKQYGKEKGIIEKQYLEIRLLRLLEINTNFGKRYENKKEAQKISGLYKQFFVEFEMENSVDDINFICHSYEMLRNLNIDEKIVPEWEQYLVKKQVLLQTIFTNFNLECKEQNIAIYGIGRHTQLMLENYSKFVGEIKANIIFIDSYKQSFTEKYYGQEIYNVHDIGNLQLDSIIISSRVYQFEMLEKLADLYGNKFKVFLFYSQGDHISFFI